MIHEIDNNFRPAEYKQLFNEKGQTIFNGAGIAAEESTGSDLVAPAIFLALGAASGRPVHFESGGQNVIGDIIGLFSSPEVRTLGMGLIGGAIGFKDRLDLVMAQSKAIRERSGGKQKIPIRLHATEPFWAGLSKGADWALVAYLIQAKMLNQSMPSIENPVLGAVIISKSVDILKRTLGPLHWLVNQVGMFD